MKLHLSVMQGRCIFTLFLCLNEYKPPFGGFMQYDVAVIGCGVIGAAVAYELSKYKLNVMVV